MKMINLLPLSIGLMAGLPVLAQNHPLDGTLKSLVRVADELDNTSKQPGYIKDMQADVDQMRAQVNGLISRGLIMPVRIADQNLSRAGWELTCTNPACRQFEAKINARGKAVENQALELNPDGYINLQKIVGDNRGISKSVQKSVKNSDYVRPLPYNAVADLESKFDASRFSILDQLEMTANARLQCIQYYTDAAKVDGLLAVNVPNGSIQWSLEKLQAKYGVSAIENLTTKQKRVALVKLNDMSAKAVEFDFGCVSPAKGAFFQLEAEKLATDVGN